MVPLLELMTNKAMKPRHWQRMADVTGHQFDVENEQFQLKNILEAPLLKYKEDIEVCAVHLPESVYLLTFVEDFVIQREES